MPRELSNRFRNEKIVEEEKNLDLKIFNDGNSEIIPGCGFSVRSEIWDLHFRETLAKRGPKLDFSILPIWIRHFVQDYIEYLLTVKKNANLTIYNHLQACIYFVEFLTNNRPDILSIKQLDYHVGKSFLKWLKTKTDSNDERARKQGHLRGFAKFIHKYHPGMTQNDFGFPIYFSLKSKKSIRSYSDYKTKDVPIETVKQIMSAISQEEKRLKNILLTAKHNSGNRKTYVKNYLIYCQALKILIASGRRTSHTLLIDKEPLKEPTSEEASGVWLTWKETKTDLDEQEVFIPSPLDQEVREAVRYVQELREDFLDYADETDKNKLFLVKGFRHPGGGPHSHPIRYGNLCNWLNGYKSNGEWRPGFMERYNITQDGEVYKFKLHGLRHTRFKQLRLGGAGIGIIQNDAKHLSTDMTIVYSTDDEVAAADFQKAIEQKELMGYGKDLIYNKEIRLDKLSPEELKRARENGMFIQFTEFGYCFLEIEKGICPTGNSCWIGEDGCGCKYHLTAPEFLPIIKEDLDLILEDYEDTLKESPNSPVIGQYNAIINRYEQIVQEAQGVQKGSKGNG